MNHCRYKSTMDKSNNRFVWIFRKIKLFQTTFLNSWNLCHIRKQHIRKRRKIYEAAGTTQLFFRFCTKLQLSAYKSSPHYSQSNGIVERYIQTIRNALRKWSIEMKSSAIRTPKYTCWLLLLLKSWEVVKTSTSQLLSSRILRGVLPVTKKIFKPTYVYDKNIALTGK